MRMRIGCQPVYEYFSVEISASGLAGRKKAGSGAGFRMWLDQMRLSVQDAMTTPQILVSSGISIYLLGKEGFSAIR